MQFSDGPGGAVRGTVRGRVAIACDGINSAIRKQFFPGRRRAALFRRQHVARRDAVEADAVGRQHGAGGMAVARQDGDLSDPPRRLRTGCSSINWVAEIETPTYRKRDWNRRGRARRFHRRVRRLAFRLARRARLHPRRRSACWNFRWSIRTRCRAGVLAGSRCSATPRTRWCRAAPTAPARRSSMRGC